MRIHVLGTSALGELLSFHLRCNLPHESQLHISSGLHKPRPRDHTVALPSASASLSPLDRRTLPCHCFPPSATGVSGGFHLTQGSTQQPPCQRKRPQIKDFLLFIERVVNVRDTIWESKIHIIVGIREIHKMQHYSMYTPVPINPFANMSLPVHQSRVRLCSLPSFDSLELVFEQERWRILCYDTADRFGSQHPLYNSNTPNLSHELG
jgi:hypothetical protein